MLYRYMTNRTKKINVKQALKFCKFYMYKMHVNLHKLTDNNKCCIFFYKKDLLINTQVSYLQILFLNISTNVT